MSDPVGANASTTWFHDGHRDDDHHHRPSSSSPPCPPSVSPSASDHSGGKSYPHPPISIILILIISFLFSHIPYPHLPYIPHTPSPMTPITPITPITLIFLYPISYILYPISYIPYLPSSYHCSSGIPSPEQAPPRYSSELATTPRHGTHPPLGQLPPPLEHRPSSPVTLPSFNSFIRGCSSPAPHSHGPHDPILLTRHPPTQNGPLSSGPLLKSWKSENISMAIDQPSPSPTLAGQQLNVPAPSLPSGYPGYALSTHNLPFLLPLFSFTLQDASPSR